MSPLPAPGPTRPRRGGRAVVVLGASVLLAGAPLAGASPLFELTGGVQGNGGLNPRAVEAGAASAYFNPAFLPDAPEGFDLGVLVVRDEIGVRLFGRSSANQDVPVESVDMEPPGGGRYAHHGLPTSWLEEGKPAAPPDPSLPPRPRQGAGSGHNLRAYQAIGFVQKLFGGRAGVGLFALVPYQRFTGAAAFYSDEREQFFSNSLHPELYADRLTSTSLAFALGARLGRTLSLGAGLTLGLRTAAQTPTYLVDVGRFEEILVDSEVRVNTALSPHVGVVLAPGAHTRLAATAHAPQRFEVITDFSFLLSNGLEQSAAVRFTHAYLPWRFALGATHELGQSGWSLAATGLAAVWSTYVDRHGERPRPSYAWFNTISTALGARYRTVATRTFLDAVYAPSPVPEQDGRSNYVDNDRLGGGAGWEWQGALWGGSVRAGLQMQAHRLLGREVHKLVPEPTSTPTSMSTGARSALVLDEVPDDAVVAGQPLPGREGLQTNNPGWPGFASSGWILAASANLSLRF